MDDAPSVPEGWYPDPAGAAPLRWWDGRGWTGSTYDPAAPPVDDGPSDPGPGAWEDPEVAAWSGAEPGHSFTFAPVDPEPYPDLFDGSAGPPSSGSRRGSRRGLLLTSVGLVLLLLGALVAVGLLVTGRERTLDVGAIEAEIGSRLSADAGTSVTVTCPETVPIQAGSVFTCDATASDGSHVDVLVQQRDDAGNVTWRIGG
ncbi:MAG: DUF4333 domain-containing protein [Frankiales bacterium]|nr:DUF4333 domain-containing protein [Frankiales bacterium]